MAPRKTQVPLFKLNKKWEHYEQLSRDGYVVVPVPRDILSKEKAREIASLFDKEASGIKYDPSAKHHITKLPAAAFLTSVRRFREHVGRVMFSNVWNTDKLASSADSYCYAPEREIKHPSVRNAHMIFIDKDSMDVLDPKPGHATEVLNPWGWAHMDASPLQASDRPCDFRVSGMECKDATCDYVNYSHTIQSLYVPEQPGTAKDNNNMTFACLPGAHRFVREFYKTFPDMAITTNPKGVKVLIKKDWIRINLEHIKWFEQKTGNKMQKIHVPQGHMVFWFSALPHCNANPTFKSYGRLVRSGKTSWKWASERTEACADTAKRMAIYCCLVPQNPEDAPGGPFDKTWNYIVNGKSTSHDPTNPRPNGGFQTYGARAFGDLSMVEREAYLEDPEAFVAKAKADKANPVIPPFPLPPTHLEMSFTEAKMYGWDPEGNDFPHHVKKTDKGVIVFPNYNNNILKYSAHSMVWEVQRFQAYFNLFGTGAPDYIPRLAAHHTFDKEWKVIKASSVRKRAKGGKKRVSKLTRMLKKSRK